MISPLNNEEVWRERSIAPPLSTFEIKAIQTEIDSICGTTRENESIVKLVWNGDKTYWREEYQKWNVLGKPIGKTIKKPIVLHKTDPLPDGKKAYIPVPRWILITRIEPEQFHPTWKRDSQIFSPERGVSVQLKPETPPKVWWVWQETIAEHKDNCCFEADSVGAICKGLYAHPRKCLTGLREQQKGIEAEGIETNPFGDVSEQVLKRSENSVNNYADQAIEDFKRMTDTLIEQTPLAVASTELVFTKDFKDVKRILREDQKREMERIEKQYANISSN